MTRNTVLSAKLDRLLDALERLAPPRCIPIDLTPSHCFVWQPKSESLKAITQINRVDLDLLCGVDHVRDKLVANTEQFANGFAANNAVLWGARGMGKSSLIKAVHAHVNKTRSAQKKVKLVEIYREDIASLITLMNRLREQSARIIVFCDDLSFDSDDISYRSLKAALDGGLEGRPENVLFYATSNRRHLLPREMIDNERATAINPSEAVEEKVSLSDRFGLWLGFYRCSQSDYLVMVDRYAGHFDLGIDQETLHRQALEWAQTRGNRSGRVAWQFIVDCAGRLNQSLCVYQQDDC